MDGCPCWLRVQVSLCFNNLGVTIAQNTHAADSGGEIAALRQLLDRVEREGLLVQAEALHANRLFLLPQERLRCAPASVSAVTAATSPPFVGCTRTELAVRFCLTRPWPQTQAQQGEMGGGPQHRKHCQGETERQCRRVILPRLASAPGG
jgi:hypothetical protein